MERKKEENGTEPVLVWNREVSYSEGREEKSGDNLAGGTDMNGVAHMFKQTPTGKISAAGTQAKMEEIYDCYAEQLYSYAMSLLRNIEAAEEAVQSCFLKIMRSPAILGEVRNIRAYLYAIVRNGAYDYASARGRETLVDTGTDSMFSESFQEDEILMQDLVNSLPAEQREVITLKIYQNMTFREIAHIIGVSQNTAASRYRYALQTLKKRLDDRAVLRCSEK